MANKRMTEAEAVSQLSSGMTIGIGGWSSRRKPMSIVKEILRSDLTDLTIVAFGGPEVGLLCAAGKVKKAVFGYVTMDGIPLDPHFRNARQNAEIEVAEYDEGMVYLGLYAASINMPFLPTRGGLASDVMTHNPDLLTVKDPYGSGQEFLAMPPIHSLRSAANRCARRSAAQRRRSLNMLVRKCSPSPARRSPILLLQISKNRSWKFSVSGCEIWKRRKKRLSLKHCGPRRNPR